MVVCWYLSLKDWKKFRKKKRKLNLILYEQIIHNFEILGTIWWFIYIVLEYWEKNKKEVMWVYFPKNKVHISKIKYKIPIYLES